MMIRDAKEKDIPRILKLLEQVLQIQILCSKKIKNITAITELPTGIFRLEL